MSDLGAGIAIGVAAGLSMGLAIGRKQCGKDAYSPEQKKIFMILLAAGVIVLTILFIFGILPR